MVQKQILRVQPYPPFSSREVYEAVVDAVEFPDPEHVRLRLCPQAGPRQAGRRVALDRPAVFSPGSPLYELVETVFGFRLAMDQEFDLSTLLGRRLRIRFEKARPDGRQEIVEVKPCSGAQEATD